MFKRKLFKRALPIILSVAMIFQSMPTTALAAESPTQETAADSEILDSDTDTVNSDVSDDSVSDASDSDENTSEESVSEESVFEEKTITEDNSEERSSEETSLEENTSSESKSEESSSEEKGTEESSSKESSSTENASEEDTSNETTIPEETSTQVLTDATEEMEGADQKEGVAEAEVLIDKDELYRAVENFGLHYDEETGTVFALYDADNSNPFRDILKGAYYSDEYEEEKEIPFFYVELDDKDNSDLRKQLRYTWKKDAEGKEDLAGVPKNAGTYYLEIKLAAIDQVCNEAKVMLPCRIDPRGIMVDYSNLNPINPGTTVKEAVESITEDYALRLTNISGNPQGSDLNKEAYVASCAVSIIRERFADGKKDGSTLKPEDVIKSNEEYSVRLEITLKDKDNYTLSNTSRKLEIAADVNTAIRANTVKTDGTNFGWLYGEKPEMEALIKAIDPYVVEADNDADSEEEKKIADAKLEYQWFDASGKELEEKPSNGTTIPEDVKDAGTYSLCISYAGEPGHYNVSKIDITVVISTVDVYIGDIKTDTEKYMEGTKVKNALQTITEYKVYKTGAKAEDKKDPINVDKYFWGVSYNGDANQNTQSYEPVFKIRRGEHVTDKDGKDSVEWDADYLTDEDSLIKTKKEDDKETNYEYRIEFSGKKAVYGENDAPVVDINNSQINYRVDTTAETLTGNVCMLNVEAATGPVIDISKILDNKDLNPNAEANKGSLKNPLTKIYDNKPLYNTKNDYKQATIKDNSNVQSTELTYQWQKIIGYTEIINDDDSIDLDAEGNNIPYNNVEYTSAPIEAGNYRLAVRYTDKKTGAMSKTEYVYYTIKKEDILITPTSNITAYYGESVGSYLADINTALRERTQNSETESEENKPLIDYDISDFTEGVENGELANETGLLRELKNREKEGEKALTWKVERKITEGENANSWYELSDTDTFVEGGEYRLTVYADWQTETDLLQNYNNRYALDFKNDRIENEQTGEYEMQARYADKQSVPITPAKTEGIEVNFEVDWGKITQTTKVYDGEPFSEEVLSAVKNAVTAYNTKTGEPINKDDITFGWRWERPGYSYLDKVEEDKAIHAGNYYLILSVEKGDKYLGQTKEYYEEDGIKTFVILPVELTVTPMLKDEIKAGTRILNPEEHYYEEYDEYGYSSEDNAQNVKNLIKNIIISGNIVEADKSYVSVEEGYYYKDSEISYPKCVGNYQGLPLNVTDKATGQQMTGYLRGDRAYNVSFYLNGGLRDDWVWNEEAQKNECKFYGTDYTLKFETKSFTAARDSSTVWETSFDDIEIVAIQDSVAKEGDSFIHTITPREGIPYSYKTYNKEKKKIGGNYFGVHIVAPAEYTDVQGAEDRVIYQNSIENAGGYILDSDVEYIGDETSTHCRYIIAAFDGSKIAENENGISFEITWEEGFTETFNITVPKTLLMEDLHKAVLPKSLAFNGASAKMTVGEGQQLDLKITKTQMADTICVAYESSDEEVLTVSDSGYVTAIHTGKATVTAYAAYQDSEDEKIKPFIDAKGNYAKAAKLNITVNKVSEVKKIKFEAHDTYAYIDYADVPDGYRREVYVLEGANVSADEFDKKINAVQNGNYSEFAAHLFITATERNVENVAGKKFWGRIDKLKPNTQYTVYVRNVSALRSFLNGAQIEESEFATAGKPVKLVTTKSQQKELNGYFKTAEGNQPVYGKTSVSQDAKSAVEYVTDINRTSRPFYEVDISAKSVKFDVEAKYWQKDQADIDYADGGDYIWYPLALTKELQKDYVNPKLTYYVTGYPHKIDENDFELSYNQKQQGYVKAGDYYFLPTTPAASIDKNGKISLKGRGSVYVLAYDAEQDKVSKPIELFITATADSVAGKPIKMKVGNTINLSNYLTYKQGKIKLASMYCNLAVELNDPDNAFTITPVAYEGNDKIQDYTITAKRPTTKPLDLTVHDKTVEANGGSAITIKLSAAALDPVKSLKAYDVYDTEGSIRFDYANGMDSKLKFRIEVKDQTGRILKNQLVDSQSKYSWRSFTYKNEAYYKALYHHAYNDDDREDEYYSIGFREYNAKKNTWTYYYDLENLDGLDLKRLSSYTVSVTAVYDGYDAKTVSTKIKTTNIPASKTNAVEYDAQGKDTKKDDGDSITVYQNKKNKDDKGNQLSTYPLLKSGNTYTLDFTDADSNARNMKTDTLTWKSSNTKVATVKANQGTYTATLKAVKKGTTQITVTSKITKKIVARWTVFVNAVGEADGYFGDNIFQDINNENLVDKLGADLLTLNNPMTFTLANGEKKWVAFKAPSDGSYSVTAPGGSFIAYDSDSRQLGNLGSSWNNKEMGKGEIVYFLLTALKDNDKPNKPPKKTSVTIKAEGEQYIALSLGADGTKVKVSDEDHPIKVTFTAPEENVYTFTALDKNGKDVSKSVLRDTTKRIEKDEKWSISVSGSGEYIIKVTPAELLKDGTKIDIKKGETKYYQFTADEANEYTIYTADATEKIVSGALYNAYLNWEADAKFRPSSDTDTNPKNVGFKTKKLDKKAVIYIALTAGDKDTTATVKAEKAPKTGESFTIAQAGGTKTVVYTVEKDGEYRFTADGTKATIQSIEVIGINNSSDYHSGAASWQKTLKKGDYVKLTVSAEDANTSVTVTCTPVEPITIKADAVAKPVKVTAGLSQKVEFTALENGWYAFNFDKDTVQIRDNTESSRAVSGTEFYEKAGGIRTFTVSTGATTEQTVNVSVTKATVDKLTNMTAPKDLTKGKTYRYYWTAENEGLYDFDFAVTGAKITSSRIEGLEGDSLATLSGYYSKGDTFYLTIKTDNSADGSFKAVIAKQDAEELKSGEEKGITVGANASKWVSFTSKWSEKIRYQYTKTDADGFDFYESTGLDDDYTKYSPFDTGSRVLRPGQKVYYKVENTNAAEKTVKLKIAPVLSKPVNVAAGTGAVKGTDTIKVGADGWYHFQAAKAGRFGISVTSKVGDTITDVNGYEIYPDLTAEDSYYKRKFWIMEAEKALYINVRNNAATDAEITVTITDLEAVAAPLELDASGKAAKPLNLKKGVTQYLLFNAKETAHYTLTVVDKDNKAYALPVTYYINRERTGLDETTPINALDLDAGSTILFAVTTTEDIDVTVTLTKETVIELTNEAALQTISAGQTLYFRAKIGDKYSRYFIETSEEAEGLTLSYQSVNGWINWNNGYADFVPAPSQEEVVFGLTAESTFEGTKTFKIRKGIVAPTPMEGTLAESGELAAYHKVWYSFTPEKAGRYSIKANGAQVYEYRNGTKGSGNWTSTPQEFFVTDEMVGKEIIYAVYHTDTAAKKKVSLSIAEVTAAEFGPEKPYTVDITKIEPGEKIWLYFKAANDGRYTFTTENSSAVLAMQWYKALEESSYDSSKYWSSEYSISSGEAYYIAIPYNTKTDKNFKISVSAVTDSTAEAVSVSETAKSFDMKAGETKWLKFTPEKTANYQFELKNTEYGQIERYDSITAGNYSVIYSGSQYAFAANKTVYFKLTANSTLAEGEKPSIQITAAEDMQTLAEGKNTIGNMAENENYKYASFTPSESAVYSFELTDSTECDVFISTDGDNYNELYSGSVKKYALDKEHPAYIQVYAYYTASASAEIMIQKISSVGEMHTGDSKDVTLTSDSNMAFYQFTAEEDGVYIFETDSKNKNTVYVYASDNIYEYLLNPDSMYGDYRGFCTIELKKGATKYIRVAENKDNLNEAEDKFALTCKKAKETSFTGEDSINLNLKSGEPVLVRWTAGVKENYQFGFASKDGSVKYKYYNSKNIDTYPYSSYSTSKGDSWSQYENSSLNGRNLILEASERTQVEVSAKIVPRSLSVGNRETVELNSSKRYEEFNFKMSGNTTYIFCTAEVDGAVNSYIIDPDGNRWDSDRTYFLGNDRYWIYSAPSMQDKTYKFRVEKPDSSSDTFNVAVFYYKNCGSNELDSTGLQISDNVQASGENWYQFNIRETDWYGFNADYSTHMNLYKSNSGRLELLGTKEYSSNKIWSALQEDDIVLLQTYCYSSHGNGNYSLNVTCDLPQSTSHNWEISGDNDSQYFNFGREHETVIPLTFSGLNDITEYVFALTSSYDSKNIVMELYQKDSWYGNEEIVAEGHSLSYYIDPNSKYSYELHISNYSSDYWYGTVTAQKQYPYNKFELSLDSNTKKLQ